MAFGRAKTPETPAGPETPARPETPKEILQAIDQVLVSFRGDPALVAATQRHTELQRIAGEANAHETGCRETLHALTWQIYEPNLLEDEKRLERMLAEVKAQLIPLHARLEAEIGNQRRPARPDLQRRGRLNDQVILLQADLDKVQGRMRNSMPRLTSTQVDAAPPPLRDAFRAARVALDAAVTASKTATEAARDALPAREQARQLAIDRLTPTLLPLHARAIREFDAALEVARTANGVMEQIVARLSAVFGSRLPIEHVGWPEFEAGRKLDMWRETMRGRAPHARLK